MNDARFHYRIGAASLFFIQGFSVATWASRLPDIQRKFELSNGELGLLLLLPPAAQLIMMLISGNLVRRFGSGRIARVAALLLPLLLPLLGLAQSVPVLAVGMFMLGLATNLSNIAANTQGLNVQRIYGKSIMASFHGWWSIGGVCAILLSMLTVSMKCVLQLHFTGAWLLCLVIYGMIIRMILPQDEVAQTPAPNASKSQSFQLSPCLLLLGLICFGNLGCEGSINSWISIYFQSEICAPETMTRIGYFAFMAAITCFRFSADWFVRRWGEFNLVRLAGCLIFAGITLIVAIPNVFASSIGCALTGFGLAAVLPICYSMLSKNVTTSLPVALSIVNGISFTGYLLMPALVGGISNHFGLRIAFAIVGIVAVMTNSLINIIQNRKMI